MAKNNSIFAQVKEMNIIADKMNGLNVNSKEYNDLADSLYWAGEALMMDLKRCKKFTLQLSKRTRHYWLKEVGC